MNAIQKISQDLLRERGGTPFDPAGHPQDLRAAQAPTQAETGRMSHHGKPAERPSVDRLARLAG